MGTLYLVATPIGNLEDITLRAIRILREVPLIAAEDTRTTRVLLKRHAIATPLTSYYEHNKLTKLDYLLGRLAEGDLALVSEAGMPGISDPGYELVRAALDRGFPVSPIPGPSAIVAALAASGLPTDQFVFLGFLPRRASDRRRLLAEVAGERRTLVCYEAPHRLIEALEDIAATLGDRPLAVARELTKIHEEILRGTAGELRAHFATTPPRGELTLVIGGGSPARAKTMISKTMISLSDEEIAAQLEQARARGLRDREAVDAVVAATGRPRRAVYRILLDHRKCDKMM
ncbi:MAG: 16S rRNA (cytidine(1402)-2'-O)-methyltransferase [Chloroflexi bacterium]|nr:16S rRNA (cytidine(1402)-2'-O)-methyltransferase [Chloroflexota bacterium]